MKKYLLAATVVAASCTTAFATPPAPIYNWSGFYIGGYAGGGWNKTTAKDIGDSAGTPWYILGTMFSTTPSSFIGGMQGGYNFQMNQFVYGVEADAGYLHLNGSALYDSDPSHSDTSVVSKGSFDATLRARFGFAFDRTLIYVTGGAIFTNQKAQVVSFSTNISPDTNFGAGWIGGGGLEYALTPNWSIKGEYLHYDLGRKTVTLAGGDSQFEIRSSGDLARVGFNYRFGGH